MTANTTLPGSPADLFEPHTENCYGDRHHPQGGRLEGRRLVKISSGVLKAQLAANGGQQEPVSFQITLGKIGEKIKHIQVDFDPMVR